MLNPPPALELSLEEGQALLERLEAQALRASDWGVLAHLLRLYLWLGAVVQEGKLTWQRLRSVLFGHRPAPPTLPVAEASEACEAEADGGPGGASSPRGESSRNADETAAEAVPGVWSGPSLSSRAEPPDSH